VRNYRSPLQKIRRLLKVLECLQSGRAYGAGDLAEVCGVTKRQIFRDLRALQDSGIALIYDESRQSYRLAQPTLLPATELTLDEALSLLALANNLGERRRGVPLQEPLRDAAVKLSCLLPLRLRHYVGEVAELIEFQTGRPSSEPRDRSLLTVLHEALHDRQRVRLRYRSLFEGRDISTLVSPYRLLFSRHSWYVVGRSSLHRSVRMFHLGRILELQPTQDRYRIPERFSLERHFGNAWQFIRERGDQRVRIRFQPQVAANVADVLWHKTQQLQWNGDGTLDFEATVSGVNEISWWVLGYGDQAEVLEPPELRGLIAERAARMVRVYRRRRK
jgi:predicted DNA-binding transcriptional regulator YafY